MNSLCWSGIQLTLLRKDKHGNYSRRSLLNDLSGKVNQGQLLAIMGPTGCGKSSLLNVLCGRVSYSSKLILEGNVLYNKKSITTFDFNKHIAYVGQDDHLFSYLTVYDTLYLSAIFASTTIDEIKNTSELTNKVNIALKELNLLDVTQTIVGSTTRRGISGGEYKRVLIGKELMKRPQTIFLDEPTSGLDSYQALSVMESMKLLATHGRIVIAVIHQPRSSIYELFDQLCLLCNGKTVYFGPSSHTIQYFNHLNYICPVLYNPADYFLDLLSVNMKSVTLELGSKQRIDYLINEWNVNGIETLANIHIDNKDATEEFKESLDPNTIIPPPIIQHPFSISAISNHSSSRSYYYQLTNTSTQHCNYTIYRWFIEFRLLFWRASLEIYGNYVSLAIKTVTVLFFAVLLSLIYQNLGNNQKSIQDRVGLLYFLLINQSFSPLVNLLSQFPSEKVIVNRELLGGSYKISSYYIGRVLAELPFQFILTVVYCTIIYWSVGLNPIVTRYLIFVLTIILTTFCAMSIGFFLSASSPTAIIASAIGPPVLIIFLLYGGFYINISSLPPGSQWVRYLSLIYWSFQVLLVNEFKGEHFTCVSTDPSCVTNGTDVLMNLSFQNTNISECLVVLFILICGFTIMGYIGLALNRERYCHLIANLTATTTTIEPVQQFQQQQVQSDLLGYDNNNNPPNNNELINNDRNYEYISHKKSIQNNKSKSSNQIIMIPEIINEPNVFKYSEA